MQNYNALLCTDRFIIVKTWCTKYSVLKIVTGKGKSGSSKSAHYTIVLFTHKS